MKKHSQLQHKEKLKGLVKEENKSNQNSYPKNYNRLIV